MLATNTVADGPPKVAVPLNGIKGLIGASGADAEAFRALVAPYGMNVKVVGAKPGGASAMKLIRSVCMKGLSAVLMESLEAAAANNPSKEMFM